MREKIGIKEIAQKAGVSITTVSRVLNNKGDQYRISKKTQIKVNKAADKLKYIPNHFAANLRTGKSNTISLLIPSLDNPFFASIASEVNAEIKNFGYLTIISDTNEDIEVEKKEVKLLISRNIEGLIIAPCGDEWSHLKSLHDKGYPIVSIDRYFENLNIPFVSTDNYKGAYNATKKLIDYGHTSIVCIQGVRKSTPNKLRVDGFTNALKESGIKNYKIVGSDFNVENGYFETKKLINNKKLPSAIFALSNTIALGCIKALKEEDIHIPEDISLIAFDNHPYLEYLATPLSCVSQSVEEICKLAVKYLFEHINEGHNAGTVNQTLIEPELILRDSIKKLSK